MIFYWWAIAALVVVAVYTFGRIVYHTWWRPDPHTRPIVTVVLRLATGLLAATMVVLLSMVVWAGKQPDMYSALGRQQHTEHKFYLYIWWLGVPGISTMVLFLLGSVLPNDRKVEHTGSSSWQDEAAAGWSLLRQSSSRRR